MALTTEIGPRTGQRITGGTLQEIHAESCGTYGWPRVHAELTLGLGIAVNHKRVARLMREAGIQGSYAPGGRARARLEGVRG
jgi:hypothetical protein